MGARRFGSNPTPKFVLLGRSNNIVVIRLPPRREFDSVRSIGLSNLKLGALCLLRVSGLLCKPVTEECETFAYQYYGTYEAGIVRIGLSYQRREVANAFASAVSTPLSYRTRRGADGCGLGEPHLRIPQTGVSGTWFCIAHSPRAPEGLCSDRKV